MRTIDKDGHRVNHWRDLNDLLTGIQHPTTMAEYHRSSIVGATKDTGGLSFADAITMARRGWRDGTSEINKLRAKIAATLEGSIPQLRPQYNVTGRFIDMGAALSGAPEFMGTLVDSGHRMRSPLAQRLHIVMQVAASGTVSHETFMRRGAAVAVLVDVLERFGVRCRIDVNKATAKETGNDADTLENVLTVKEDNEPLSLDKLAFMLGHVATLRRLFWAAQEHEDDKVRRKFGIGRDMGCYGMPGEASDKGDIYVGRILTAADWDEDFTFAWLESTLIKQGIALERK